MSRKFKFVFIAMLNIGFQFCGLAQLDCLQYHKMELESINEEWVHHIQDTTIVGHEVPFYRFTPSYTTPTHHISPFYYPLNAIQDNYLYSFVPVMYDADNSGHLIEKIDLITGEPIWQQSTDLRHVAFREKIFEVEIKGDTLITYGLRCPYPENELGLYTFSNGNVDAVFFERGHDIETGMEIYSQGGDHQDTLTLFMKNSLTKFDDRHMMIDDTLHYFESYRWTDGVFLLMAKADRFGKIIEPLDTVIRSDFNHISEEAEQFTLRSAWSKHKYRETDKHFLYVDMFVPNETSPNNPMAMLREFDKNFNEVRRVDVKEFFDDTFINVSVIKFTEDYILLLVTQALVDDPDSFEEVRRFYIVLDTDYNLIEKAEFVHDDDLNDDIESVWNFSYDNRALSHDGLFYASLSKEIDDKYFLEFYKSNGSGIGAFTLAGESAVSPNQIIPRMADFKLLDNGDYLCLMRNVCLGVNDPLPTNNYYEWWRIPKDQITRLDNILANTISHSLALYPNPSYGKFELTLEGKSITSVTIYSLDGQLVFHRNTESQNNKVTIDNFEASSGMYVVIVSDQDGKLYHRKLIVE